MHEFQSRQTFPLAYEAVAHEAPAESGIYAIQTARQWLYVGETDDIRQDLFRHLNHPTPCMRRAGPLVFSVEAIASPERRARQQALIVRLAPLCQRRTPPRDLLAEDHDD